MFQQTTRVTTAEILALAVTPIQLLPTPGPNRILIPIGFSASFHAGVTPFLGGSQINFYIGPVANGNEYDGLVAALLTSAVDDVQNGPPAVWTGNNDVAANLANQPLLMKTAGAAFTAGNGSVDITVYYAVAPL